MMEAASTSETLVNFYHTIQCNIPEDSHLHMQWRSFFVLITILGYSYDGKVAYYDDDDTVDKTVR
jgi:hypothetical protein